MTDVKFLLLHSNIGNHLTELKSVLFKNGFPKYLFKSYIFVICENRV